MPIVLSFGSQYNLWLASFAVVIICLLVTNTHLYWRRRSPTANSPLMVLGAIATGNSNKIGEIALERLTSETPDPARLDARVTELEAQHQLYQTAIENITQGVCVFDADQRLVLFNRRYAEIYNLRPEQLQPGATLREIIEARVAAGTSPMAVEDFLATRGGINSGDNAGFSMFELLDGRSIQVYHQPLCNGGWVATHDDISELKANRTVANERISLQALIDWVPDYLWVKDTESRFVIVNKALASDSGRAKTIDMIGLDDFDLHAPELAQTFRAMEQDIVASGQAMIDKEELVIDAAGGKKWLSSTKVPLRNDRGEIGGLVGVARDITTRKLADALRDGQAQILEMIAMSAPLKEVLERLMHLVESQLTEIYSSVLLLDENGRNLRHGAAPSLAAAYVEAIDGVPIGPKAGSCGTAVHRRETVIVSDIAQDPLWEDYRELAAAHGYLSCWSTPIVSHQGTVLGTFALYSKEVREPTILEMRLIDTTTRIAGIAIERKRSEDQIQFLANHDALTRLPNRSLLKDRLSQAILYAQRYDRWVTVLFIDLDNFKFINDSLGHNAGDELLKQVADRMLNCVRSTDTVVRLGGDEFVIILFDQPKNLDHISSVVQKIMTAVAEPADFEGHRFRATCSIGIASYPNDGMEADGLLANADAAMYRAKEIGRDNFQFFTPLLNVQVHEKFLLQEEMRNAVANSEFALHYQPQVDLRTGRVFAVEALIRWKHPSLGMVSPAKFIPLAEETGLIVPIGDWVLREACRQNKAWQDAGLPPLTVCVNISARQFREKELYFRVVEALKDSGLQAKHLELELTESLIMQNTDWAIATMKALQCLGVQLSIDDFGTGYSSLSALKNFPVARLKIDKTFVDHLAGNESDRAVASAVISLGQKLNLRVIAEGVETDEQIAFLRENNCDEMQGYHFSKPIPAEGIENMLRIS